MARAKSTKKAAESKPKAEVILLTMYERLKLAKFVLSQGTGPRFELWCFAFRAQVLYPSAEEIKTLQLELVGPGSYGCPPALKSRMMVDEFAIAFESKDLGHTRDCFKLLAAKNLTEATPEFSQLQRKFFSEEELIEIADKFHPEK